jgi:hypothetical protein
MPTQSKTVFIRAKNWVGFHRVQHLVVLSAEGPEVVSPSLKNLTCLRWSINTLMSVKQRKLAICLLQKVSYMETISAQQPGEKCVWYQHRADMFTES